MARAQQPRLVAIPSVSCWMRFACRDRAMSRTGPLVARFCPDRVGHNRTVLHESDHAVFGDHVLHHTEAWRDVVREAARVVRP